MVYICCGQYLNNSDAKRLNLKKVIKRILTILTIFCFSLVHAQYEWTPAEVILKNGTSFTGLVKFPKYSGGLVSIGTTEFKYKINEKSKTEKYGHDTVDEVIFGDEDIAAFRYKYVPITEKKYVLLEQIVKGKVTLYSRTVLTFQNTLVANPNILSSGNYSDNTEFYLMREGEQKATLIDGPYIFVSFVSKTKIYFSDCSKIVDYLDSGLYTFENVVELVEDYNLLCE